MPLRLRQWTISGTTLSYPISEVLEEDEEFGLFPPEATISGEIVSVKTEFIPQWRMLIMF